MKNLCKAIIWNACFLEMSGDDIVNPDSAVKALEDLANTMRESTEEEKRAFMTACAEEADRLRREAFPAYTKTAEFIRNLPDSLGL